jgi:copper(I)-binding protein
MQILASARQQLSDAGFEPLPRIVLVSVDPERDSPEVIRDYVRHFGETNLGITGELEEIRKLTKSLGVYFQKIESDSEYYTVDHYPGVLVMNPAGQLNAIFGTPLEIANLVHDLPIIIENAEKTMPAAALVASGIEVAKPTPQSKMAAGYLSLRNTSDEPVTITRVTSPEYGLVEMHETITEGGVSRMRPIDEVTIPPGRIFYFKRGGKHLMLMQPDGAPSSVTLKFHTGESVVLTVSVPLRD